MLKLAFWSLLFTLGAVCAQAPLPECRYDDLPTAHDGYDDWRRTLLDTIYKLPKHYAPTDLIPVSEANLPSNFLVRAFVLPDLKALMEAAEAAGKGLELQSAYRSYDYQARTFRYWLEREGEATALKSSARAGHSEHQLGTTLDFRSQGGPAPWSLEDWAKTPAGAWLAENAHLYGFVMSYPKGRSDITCYIYEPWHYRYVGRETAQVIKESGLTLREWLWRQASP